ncbi:hypothetical protein OROGR_025174 [Orobanche gracilis]
MSWNSQMDLHCQNHSMPYNSIGSFVDFFGGLTYDHVNYIFADPNYVEESAYNTYPATSIYKFAVSEPGSFSYYEYGNGYVVDNHILETDEYSGHLDNLSAVADDPTTVLHGRHEGNLRSNSHARPVECPRNHQDARDREVAWQDNIDPDNMTYEECVICQMEYIRGDKRMTLPCKHLYHTGCGRRWLSINKACPICYKEVIVDDPKH